MTRFGGIPTRLFISSLVLAAGASACGGGEALTEELIERQLENEAGVEGVDIDLETGEIRVETEDGTIEFDSDGDGGFTVESDDGTFEQQAGVEVPDDFPSDVPRPEGEVVNAVQQTLNGETSYSLFLTSSRSIGDVYDQWKTQMLAAGFAVGFESLGTDAVTGQFENDTWQVTFSGASSDGETSLQFNVFPIDA